MRWLSLSQPYTAHPTTLEQGGASDDRDDDDDQQDDDDDIYIMMECISVGLSVTEKLPPHLLMDTLLSLRAERRSQGPEMIMMMMMMMMMRMVRMIIIR